MNRNLWDYESEIARSHRSSAAIVLVYRLNSARAFDTSLLDSDSVTIFETELLAEIESQLRSRFVSLLVIEAPAVDEEACLRIAALRTRPKSDSVPILVYGASKQRVGEACIERLLVQGPIEFADASHAPTLVKNRIASMIELHQLRAKQIGLTRQEPETTLTVGRIGIFRWDLKDLTAHWSDETYRILGLETERPRPSYERFLECVHPKDRLDVKEIVDQAISQQTSFEVLFRTHQFGMTPRWIQLQAQVFADPQDAPKMLGLVQDITKRKEVEEEALESEERFRLIVDSIPQGVWRTNPDGSADYFSSRFSEMVPCDTSNFLEWGWTEPIHPEDKPRLVAEWQRCREAAIPVSVEFRLRADDGTYIWFLSEGRPLIDEKGVITKYYGTWTNIDSQKRAAIELQNAKVAAEKANDLKTAFLANMSHEIRTPLGAMLGFADLLRDPQISDDDRRDYIDILHRNGQQLGHIINDILDLSKVETGQLNFEHLRFNTNQMASEVMSLFALQAKDRGIEMRLVCDPSAPQDIVSDPTRVRQILNNIIGNALKFTETGSITTTIRGEPDGSPECVIFEVVDTGIGIPEQSREHLFRVFTQADNSITRKYGGTGLGLALSRSLARGLGGELELVRSGYGGGSVFQLRIPNRRDEAVSNDVKKRPVAEPAKLRALEGVRVLVVEDAADNRHLIERYLSRQGAILEFAENGREGVNQALDREHDFIVMDIQMPVMDGYTAVSELRRRGYAKPILALTAHAMTDVRDRCLTAGFTDFLPKPIDSKQLVSKIAEYTRELKGAS